MCCAVWRAALGVATREIVLRVKTSPPGQVPEPPPHLAGSPASLSHGELRRRKLAPAPPSQVAPTHVLAPIHSYLMPARPLQSLTWQPGVVRRVLRVGHTSMKTIEAECLGGRAFVKVMGNPEGPHRLAA